MYYYSIFQQLFKFVLQFFMKKVCANRLRDTLMSDFALLEVLNLPSQVQGDVTLF